MNELAVDTVDTEEEEVEEVIDTTDIFFKIKKNVIKSKLWIDLSLHAKAFLPVIGVHKNKDDRCFLSIETILYLAGLENYKFSAENVLEELHNKNFIFADKRKRNKKGISTVYDFTILHQKQKDNSIFFYKDVVSEEVWQKLIPSAKSLYIVMRGFAYSDIDYYENTYERDYEGYKDRKYDICEADTEVLMKYAGIKKASFYKAIKNLKEEGLIEKVARRYGGAVYKVFVTI